MDPLLLDEPFSGPHRATLALRPAGHDRVRMRELFAFNHHLEMDEPSAQRVWSDRALPSCTATGRRRE